MKKTKIKTKTEPIPEAKKDNGIFVIDSIKKEKVRDFTKQFLSPKGNIINSEPDIYVGYVDHLEGGQSQYFVKTNQNNQLFDPQNKDAPRLDGKIAHNIGKPATYRYIKVSNVVFEYYKKFLAERNKSFVSMAQREIDNQTSKIVGVTIKSPEMDQTPSESEGIAVIKVTKSEKPKSSK